MCFQAWFGSLNTIPLRLEGWLEKWLLKYWVCLFLVSLSGVCTGGRAWDGEDSDTWWAERQHCDPDAAHQTRHHHTGGLQDDGTQAQSYQPTGLCSLQASGWLRWVIIAVSWSKKWWVLDIILLENKITSIRLLVYIYTNYMSFPAESLLTDNECPHKVKSDLTSHGFHCTFAFKRTDAKIAWPILSWSAPWWIFLHVLAEGQDWPVKVGWDFVVILQATGASKPCHETDFLRISGINWHSLEQSVTSISPTSHRAKLCRKECNHKYLPVKWLYIIVLTVKLFQAVCDCSHPSVKTRAEVVTDGLPYSLTPYFDVSSNHIIIT